MQPSNDYFISHVIVIVLISGTCYTRAENYPDVSYNNKPCMKLKNTVNSVVPICTPSGDGGFTQESKDNCARLKDTCPEFNEWECLWYEYTNPKLSAPLQFPTCRLKYYARRYTWGEIYYTNQYGTGPNVANDIVELHRFIKKKGAFPNEQEDWPKNVLDPKGERGLHWTYSPNLLGNLSTYYKPSPELLCQKLVDSNSNCAKQIVKFNDDNFKYGIGSVKRPANNSIENRGSAIFFEIHGMCDYMMVNNVKTPVCRVLYVRKSGYFISLRYETGEKVITKRTSQQWLEVQIWQKTLADPKTKKQAEFGLRYAPFNYEMPVD